MGHYLWKLRVSLLFSFLLIIIVFGLGYSQEVYPSRPITFIVAFPAGGATDLMYRLLTKEAERYIGQPIVVVNRPGGGGTIGVSAVASAKGDGYTIGQNPSGGFLAIMPYLEKLPYHPLKDFRYIMQFSELNFGVIVKADSHFKTFKDIITYARENPKKLTYATNSPRSISNLIIEHIARKEGVEMTHIPFRGSAEYQNALLGGHVQFTAGEFSYSLLEAGQIRVLLFLGERRSEEYSQIPILKDLGYDLICPVFNGVAGPKDITDEISKKLEDAFTKAVKEQAFIKGMKDLHITIRYRNSKEFADYVKYNYERFGNILKEMGYIK